MPVKRYTGKDIQARTITPTLGSISKPWLVVLDHDIQPIPILAFKTKKLAEEAAMYLQMEADDIHETRNIQRKALGKRLLARWEACDEYYVQHRREWIK